MTKFSDREIDLHKKYLDAVYQNFYNKKDRICDVCKKEIVGCCIPVFHVQCPDPISEENIKNPSIEHLKFYHKECEVKVAKEKLS